MRFQAILRGGLFLFINPSADGNPDVETKEGGARWKKNRNCRTWGGPASRQSNLSAAARSGRPLFFQARLSSSQESITEAAFQSGYNNLANFNRRFREITGFTPSEFRLQARRMQQDSGKPFVMRLGRDGAVRVTPIAATSGVAG